MTPPGAGLRNYLTIFARHNGRTWPHKKLVWPYGCHSYSDGGVLPDERVAALICTANGTG